jgi:hypothetical protein
LTDTLSNRPVVPVLSLDGGGRCPVPCQSTGYHSLVRRPVTRNEQAEPTVYRCCPVDCSQTGNHLRHGPVEYVGGIQECRRTRWWGVTDPSS